MRVHESASFLVAVTSFLFLLTLPGCTALQILSPASHAGEQLQSPRLAYWAGPSEFTLNASAIDAPLVDIGSNWDELCKLGSNDTLRTLIAGKIVLVSAESSLPTLCDREVAYLNAVDAGARGLILFLNQSPEVRPGVWFHLRGWSPRRTADAMRKTVPMVQVSRQAGQILRTLVAESDLPVYLVLTADENEWVVIMTSWQWILAFRVLVPLGYAAVFLFGLSIMSGGYKWGTTKSWVLWVEVLPANLFCFACVMGSMYESSTLPLGLQNSLISRFKFCELLTTVLVARFWQAHAHAKTGNVGAPKDPMSNGWVPTILSFGAVFFDVCYSFQVAMRFGLSFVHSHVVLIYSCLSFLGQFLAGIWLFWHCGRVLFSPTAARKPSSRLEIYILMSVSFIVLDIVGSILVIVGVYTSPQGFLGVQIIFNAARIGTALCQLTVFKPLKRRSGAVVLMSDAVGPVSNNPMATRYLISMEENQRLIHSIEITRQKVAVEREDLIVKLESSNSSLQAAVKKLESKHKAERVLHHTAKNAMAEAQSSIELYIEAHVDTTDARSLQTLRETVVGLQHGLQIIWRSLQIASIFEGSYKPKSEVILIRPWATGKAPAKMALLGETGAFQVDEPVVAELFKILTYDNVTFHGLSGSGVGFCSTFEDGHLTLDISNAIDNGTQCSHASKAYSFSTGLGLGDLRDVCKLRGIRFISGRGEDGLWHSAVRLKATRAKVKSSRALACKKPPTTHFPKHVIIVDDMPSILKVTAFKLKKRVPGATIEAVRIHTKASHRYFIDVTVPRILSTCDLLLMDQHLNLDDEGIVEGTELVTMLLEAGCKACFIMHTGNNTEDNIEEYLMSGAHGVIGKGGLKIHEEALAIYQRYADSKL